MPINEQESLPYAKKMFEGCFWPNADESTQNSTMLTWGIHELSRQVKAAPKRTIRYRNRRTVATWVNSTPRFILSLLGY
jgi:hypothetical protein